MDVLEQRALLAEVMQAIQIDNQAPKVLAESADLSLLQLQDSDSTRIFATDGTPAGTVRLADSGSGTGHLWSTDGQTSE